MTSLAVDKTPSSELCKASRKKACPKISRKCLSISLVVGTLSGDTSCSAEKMTDPRIFSVTTRPSFVVMTFNGPRTSTKSLKAVLSCDKEEKQNE